MKKHELKQIIREEIQKLMSEDINADKYKKLAGAMLKLVEEIVDDYLEEFDTAPDKKAAKSVTSESDLIEFYKGVFKNLKIDGVSVNAMGDIKKEVKKLFSKNNIEINGKAHLLDVTPSYKIGDNVKFKNGEVWKVVSPGVKGNKIFLAPSNAIAKRDHVSLAIEFTPDELKDTVIE